MSSLETNIKERARQLGFELVGIARASEADTFAQLTGWLARGFAGAMDYMERHGAARKHPASILPEVKSVVMVAMCYGSQEDEGARARIARYARGDDYHAVLRGKLKNLLSWLQIERPSCRGRAVVDTAPLLERDFARRAGLGWFGKNTMLLNTRVGSYFLLGGLLLDFELTADEPFSARHCGTCTACLDACPTAAFPAPGVLDSRRCISYLTIELRERIDEELRPLMGDWLFGCDVCQEVCPWNRRAPPGREPALAARADLAALDPIELLGIDEAEFRRRFRGTALERPGRRGLLRNAAIVLANRRDRAGLPALQRAANDEDDVIRDAARWAISQLEGHDVTSTSRTS
ncbi:MAG: tRNA epoxyqueuosine(34) reductase QueG [Gemmataceae bacterium]